MTKNTKRYIVGLSLYAVIATCATIYTIDYIFDKIESLPMRTTP